MTRGELGWMVAMRGAAWVVAPCGRIDEGNASAFAERLALEIDAAARAGSATLAIDLAGLDYMSSRGLRGLTLAQRNAGESGVAIVLVQPNPTMREILAISRYDKVFRVFNDMDQIDAA